MNESQYINLQSKKWRAITVNWDILSQYSLTESRLYCLTDFQAAWLLSMTEYMRWSTRWENCPCTQNDLEALKAEMDYNLMSCLDFQQWQLQAIYDAQSGQQIGVYESLWNGSDPSSVNPSAPDDYFNGDDSADRNDALCTALTIWVYSYVVEWSSKASVVLGIANFVSDFISFIIGVGNVIPVVTIKDLVSPLQAQFDAVQNQNAVDLLICDWVSNLEGIAITASNWSNAVQSLAYTPMSDIWYIQQLLNDDSEQLGNFLSFVNSLGNSYNLAQLGVSVCPCDDTWSFTCDFEVENCDFYPYSTPAPYDDPQGEYVDFTGWSYTDVQAFATGWARATNPSIDFEETYINTVEFTFDFTVGVWQQVSNVAVAVFGYLNGSLVFTATQSRFDTPNGSDLTFLATPTQNLDTIRTIVRPSTSSVGTGNLSGSALMTSITITGNGDNPF